MTAGQAQQVVRRLLGYFPSPGISDEEAVAWAEELTNPDLAITVTEALAVVRKVSYSGQIHRPRPGAIVAAVKAERRAQARITDTARMLAEGRDGVAPPERAAQWIAACRRVVAGESLEEATRAVGVA